MFFFFVVVSGVSIIILILLYFNYILLSEKLFSKREEKERPSLHSNCTSLACSITTAGSAQPESRDLTNLSCLFFSLSLLPSLSLPSYPFFFSPHCLAFIHSHPHKAFIYLLIKCTQICTCYMSNSKHVSMMRLIYERASS